VAPTVSPARRFVDVGANMGAYSFAAHACVGPSGRVLALEADPFTHGRLAANVARNDIRNIVPINVGVAGKRCTLRLWRNTTGNRGGNTFLATPSRQDSVEVRCEPLYDILVSHGVERVDAMKLDIEGFEYEVLRAFFRDAPATLHPPLIIMEFRPGDITAAGGSAFELVQQHGYGARLRAHENYILVKAAGRAEPSSANGSSVRVNPN
jgi:FkbM family methyltransferase